MQVHLHPWQQDHLDTDGPYPVGSALNIHAWRHNSKQVPSLFNMFSDTGSKIGLPAWLSTAHISNEHSITQKTFKTLFFKFYF